jgi:hypothetical protein
MIDNATAVLGNGTSNLDNGLGNMEAQLNAFDGILNGNVEEELEEDVLEEEESNEDNEEQEVVEDDEVEEEAEEDEEVPTDDAEYYVVEIEGEQFEVTEQELLSGYQRQKDYTRKTTEVSEQRKENDALKEQLSSERDGYIAQMEQIAKDESDAVTARFSKVNWAQLRADNPTQYMLLREDLQAAQANVQSSVDKRKLAVDARAKQLDTQHSERVEAEFKRVEEFIPDFTDELRSKLQTQAEVEGFSDADNKLLSSAQVIKLLDKARKYDELQERRETVVKKKATKQVPKLIKPGSASEATVQKSSKKKQYEASKKKYFQNSNDRDAAVDVFSKFL